MIELPYPVVLASESPRRQEILGRLVREFLVVPSNVDEEAVRSSNPWDTAKQASLIKAKSVAALYPDHLVIAGDTLVVVPLQEGYDQLFKPTSKEDAISMLGRLSGREHLVITGMTLCWPEGVYSFEVTTSVGFRALTASEIREYVDTNEPMDKAGAYAIQGGAAAFVSSVNGSTTNVIGLPLEELTKVLHTLFP